MWPCSWYGVTADMSSCRLRGLMATADWPACPVLFAAISYKLADALNPTGQWPPVWCNRRARIYGLPDGRKDYADVYVVDRCGSCEGEELGRLHGRDACCLCQVHVFATSIICTCSLRTSGQLRTVRGGLDSQHGSAPASSSYPRDCCVQ